MAKAVKRRVGGGGHPESSRLVRGDMKDAAEHGLGAGRSIGRPSRVRPLLRFEAAIAANKVVPRKFYALGAIQGRFSFLGGKNYVSKL